MIFRPIVEMTVIVLFELTALVLVALGFWRAKKTVVTKMGRMNVAIKWGRRLLVGVTLGVAFAGPSVPAQEIQVTSNIEIVFAVDRTGSMAAEDGPDGAPRLDAVRQDIVSVLQATVGSRYAVVTWDADARVELPFTTDAYAVKSFAEVLHQEVSEFSAGSAGERPLTVLLDLLESAEEQRPENIRYLLVFTDGEVTRTDDDQSYGGVDWDDLTPHIDGGAVFGYGTEEGGPMRIYQPGGAGTGEYMVDPDSPDNPVDKRGEPLAISKIDLVSLKQVANALNVDLFVNPTEQETEEVGNELIEHATLIEDSRGMRHTFRYMIWVPAAIAGLLLVWEFASIGRQMARFRRSGVL